MVCGRCGTENPAETFYCGKCGRSLQASDASAPRHRDRSSLLRREAAVVLFGILILVAAAYGAWYLLFFQHSPVAVVRGFLDADIAAQYAQEETYVTRGIEAQFILSTFQALRKQTGASPFKGYTINDATSSGNSAYVHVSIPMKGPVIPGVAPAPGMPGNTTMTVTFALMRQDNEWKIEPMETLASVTGVLVGLGYQQIAPNLPNITGPGALPNLGIPPTAPPGVPPSSPTTPSPDGAI